MKKIIILRAILVIFILIFSLLIWFIGADIQIRHWIPFESKISRLVIIAAVIAFLPLKILLKYLLTKRDEKKIAASFVEYSLKDSGAESKKSAYEFKHQLKKLVVDLRKGQMRSGKKMLPLQKLPWFLIVGPLHYGKTAIVENSGLHFPLLTDMNAGSHAGGISGLKWFVTEEAVFLEYSKLETASDWDNLTNNEAWVSMLKVLNKYKKDKPINGVITTIDMAAFLNDSETERKKKIDGIRHYLKDLYERLHVRLPVYVVVTKCDQVAGFLEYFDKCSIEEREQILGFTLPLGRIKDNNLREILNTEYDQFIHQLNNRLVWLLDQEKNPHRRSRLCFFPQQLLLLKEVIIESFISTLMPNKLYELIEFRGVYFTSAVPQNNSECDPLNFLIVKQFDLVPITHLDRITKTGGFFLKKLYGDLIIPEAGIVNYNDAFRKSRLIGNYFSYIIAICFVALGASCLMAGYAYNKSHTKQAIAYLQQFERIEPQFKDQVALTEILTVLNVLKKAIDVYENDHRKWLLSYKLYQSPSILAELKATLKKELEINFLPKIALRLENLLLLEQNQTASLYELFKAYLVLQNPSLLPKDWLKKVIETGWENDEKITKVQKQELSHYLDFILGASFEPLALNQALIEETTNNLLQDPLEMRVYSKIKTEAKLIDFPLDLIKLTDANRQVFEKPLTHDMLPALYTKEGFTKQYSPWLLSISNTLQQEAELIDRALNGKFLIEKRSHLQLMEAVNILYSQDYLKHWQQAILGIKLISYQDLDEILEAVALLKTDHSPVTKILNLLTENLGVISHFDLLPEKNNVLTGLILMNDQKTKNSVTNVVAALQTIQDLENYLKKIHKETDIDKSSYLATRSIMKGVETDPIHNLSQHANELPEPLKNWFHSITANTWKILMVNSNRHINKVWQKEVLAKYQDLKKYYPFNPDSKLSMSTQNFVNFFGTQGTVNKFFEEYLSPYLDTSVSPWRWNSLYDIVLSDTEITAEKLENLVHVCKTLFPNDAKDLAFNFSVLPLNLSSEVASVVMKIGDQDLTYRHGPQEKTLFKWPATNKAEKITISFRTFEDQLVTQTFDGPWSLLKFMNKDSLLPESHPDHFKFRVNIGKYKADFLLNMSDAKSLLALPLEELEFPDQF